MSKFELIKLSAGIKGCDVLAPIRCQTNMFDQTIFFVKHLVDVFYNFVQVCLAVVSSDYGMHVMED